METDLLGGLLLPIGLWLLLSAGTPSQLHRRLAVATLIAISTATLTFIAFGFALAFGGSEGALGFGIAPERWIFVGLSGFFLDGATDLQSLETFIRFWPLVAAAAVLVAGALGHQARAFALVAYTVVAAGIALPVAMCWMWGGGWLHALGPNVGLGRGAVDIGHLAVAGIVAGASSIAWLRTIPRREPASHEPELPVVHFPSRAVAGVLFVLASVPVFANAFAPDEPRLPIGQFVGAGAAVSIAILTAGAYTIFTTRRPDVLSASRAALGAVLATSSGGALLPMPIVALLGIFCGLLATVGYYMVNEKLRWRDDSAIVTSVLVPAATGLLTTGTFANGAFGVTGWLSPGARLESGQLLAQVIAVLAITLLATSTSGALLALMRFSRIALLVPPEIVYARSSESPPTASASVAAVEFADVAQAVDFAYASATEAANLTAVGSPPTQPNGDMKEQSPAPNNARPSGWFTRLRRGSEQPAAPKQPRKVAYPYRVGGRPLMARPPSVANSDASEEPSTTPRSEAD
ncbi:MAG: hypothetical protein RML99_06715 [Anaerolineae bacterium]|nr:hypothetical protein [Anaerolineae bacterium]